MRICCDLQTPIWINPWAASLTRRRPTTVSVDETNSTTDTFDDDDTSTVTVAVLSTDNSNETAAGAENTTIIQTQLRETSQVAADEHDIHERQPVSTVNWRQNEPVEAAENIKTPPSSLSVSLFKNIHDDSNSEQVTESFEDETPTPSFDSRQAVDDYTNTNGTSEEHTAEHLSREELSELDGIKRNDRPSTDTLHVIETSNETSTADTDVASVESTNATSNPTEINDSSV
jgi:hypothetical protein